MTTSFYLKCLETHCSQEGLGQLDSLFVYLASQGGLRPLDGLRAGHVISFRAPRKQLGKSQVALVVKNPPASAGDVRDMGSIPGSGRSPEAEHDNPLQYLPRESHGQRRQAIVHIAKSCKESDTTEAT